MFTFNCNTNVPFKHHEGKIKHVLTVALLKCLKFPEKSSFPVKELLKRWTLHGHRYIRCFVTSDVRHDATVTHSPPRKSVFFLNVEDIVQFFTVKNENSITS